MIDAFELLWPSVCAGCDVPATGRLCPTCRDSLCTTPIEAPIACVRAAYATSRYPSGPARILRRAKYGADPGLMSLLALAFAEVVAPLARDLGADAVVPAPSPWDRRVRRGFAPAAALARALSHATGTPTDHVLWIGRGLRQAGLGAAARARHARRRVHLARPTVRGRILLVDDVVTTGATAAACATELLGGGADEVWLVALAVAGPGGSEVDAGASGQPARTRDRSTPPPRRQRAY